MSRFGIRNKIRALFGGAGSAANESGARPVFDVKITAPNGSEYTVQGKEGETLVTVTGRGAWPIMTGCAEGDCGTCRVEVLGGADGLSPANEKEQRTCRDSKVPEGWRLGCQTRLQGAGVHLHVIDPFAEAEAAEAAEA